MAVAPRVVGKLALVWMLVAHSRAASAEPTAIEFLPGQAGLSAAVSYDRSGERVSGARLTTFADFRGLGLALSADYQTLRERRELSTFSRPSATLGLALRISPVSYIVSGRGPDVLSYVDVFATAGFEGGLTWSIDGLCSRGSTWLGAGGEIRFGRWYDGGRPGLRLEFQRHGNLAPSFNIGDLLMLGVTWSG